MGAALGNVFNNGGLSTTGKIKQFAGNSIGLHGFSNALDPAQLDYFASSSDIKKRADAKAADAQAGIDATNAAQTASEQQAAADLLEQQRRQQGSGRASNMLTSNTDGAGGRAYLGAI